MRIGINKYGHIFEDETKQMLLDMISDSDQGLILLLLGYKESPSGCIASCVWCDSGLLIVVECSTFLQIKNMLKAKEFSLHTCFRLEFMKYHRV
jgi:hypothetical protein